MVEVHATAIVEAGAELGTGVVVGPYCTVGADVALRDGVKLISHVTVAGRTTIGPDTIIYPFASIGTTPQDLKYKGESSRLEIGANNIIREHVTINPGTEGGGMVTRVGDSGLFMTGAHVAHDCKVGNHVVCANYANLAGHVVVDDFAIIGGLAAVHQHCRIGAHSIVGGMSGVAQDLIPYGSAMGDRACLVGVNVAGLQRRDFSHAEIGSLRKAYRLLFAEEGTLSERLDDLARMYSDDRRVMDVVNFIRADSTRAICQPKAGHAT